MAILNTNILLGEIVDINVIVPGKVVEIIFLDGKKEKMVRHPDDLYDLRKCCFIGIAKHLYRDTYTQEGIEWMATQLSYQKRYAKIVDRALKRYHADIMKKQKDEKLEKEKQEIRIRQMKKREKQREKRRQRRHDAIVRDALQLIQEIQNPSIETVGDKNDPERPKKVPRKR